MKRAYWSILTLALLMIVSEARSDELDTPHIVVYGTATIQVTPNQMLWLLNVRNIDPSSSGAATAHESTIAAVMAFLKKNQVAEETIQTSRMQLGVDWDYSKGPRQLIGYFASTDVRFTLSDLSKYSSIWMGLSGIQGVQIGDVSPEHSDRIQYQNEARTKAVLSARDKARAIADTLDVRIGEPLMIEEDLSVAEAYRFQLPTTSNSQAWVGDPSSVDRSLAPGSIPIKVRVKAIFRMQTK